jgi:electron transport complex protein RnfG
VGVTADGKISGVRVPGGHNETPGLGAEAEKPDFYEQFAGKDASLALRLVKDRAGAGAGDIAAISGATITSDAVTKAVNAAAQKILSLK